MADRIHAPELAGALEWFNVPAPLTLKALRGKVVLLDFWTYGAGDTTAGHADGPVGQARFHEPGGLAATTGLVFVADTNNHAVRRITVADGLVDTLRITGI